MIYIALALILLSIILILIAPIDVRILAGKKLNVEVEYIFIKVILSDFGNKVGQKDKKSPIAPRQIIRLIRKALSLSRASINIAAINITREQTEKAYSTLGFVFALLYPTVVTLHSSCKDVQIGEGAINLTALTEQESSTTYELDAQLSAPLFSAFRLLLCYLHEYSAHKRRRRKWKTR